MMSNWEIAVTTRGSAEGYLILKCPKRDEALGT